MMALLQVLWPLCPWSLVDYGSDEGPPLVARCGRLLLHPGKHNFNRPGGVGE